MLLKDQIQGALQQYWTKIYTKFLTIVLCYGASIHLLNIFSFTDTNWLNTPLLWRCLDLVLLIFNLVVGFGLWKNKVWGVWLFFIGILSLQFLPYLLFRSYFIFSPEDNSILNNLLITEGLLILILALLIKFKK